MGLLLTADGLRCQEGGASPAPAPSGAARPVAGAFDVRARPRTRRRAGAAAPGPLTGPGMATIVMSRAAMFKPNRLGWAVQSLVRALIWATAQFRAVPKRSRSSRLRARRPW